MPFARAISSNASPNAGRANERRTLKQMMLPIAAEKVGRETHTPRTGRFAGAWLIASGLKKPRGRLLNQTRTSRSSVRCSRRIVTSWISFAAAQGPPSNFQVFPPQAKRCFWFTCLQFSFLPHGRRAGETGKRERFCTRQTACLNRGVHLKTTCFALGCAYPQSRRRGELA